MKNKKITTDNSIEELVNIPNKDKNRLFLISAIGLATLMVRLLIDFDYYSTALMYIGIPYLVALAILFYTRESDKPYNLKSKYWNKLRMALIIMLGSSIILFEGFLCVLMFMPIYFFVLLITFIADYYTQKNKNKDKGKTLVHVFSLIILALSLEGTHENLSFDRNHNVSVTYISNQSVDEIKNNLIQPIHFDSKRPWFLKLFPQPYDVAAGSLEEGDIHEIKYRYHRWFFTNTHEGKILLEIDQVKKNKIETLILEDTSYMSNYINFKGTEIQFKQLEENKTEITLTINFERKLDPSWYFKPLEEYGIGQTAHYLMNSIILRE